MKLFEAGWLNWSWSWHIYACAGAGRCSCARVGRCSCAGVGRYIVEKLIGELVLGAGRFTLVLELVGVVVQE